MAKKCAVLFSGGKDSCLALHMALKEDYDVRCLISLMSENPESFMFHTPSISNVEKQAEVMEIPIITKKTKGKEEIELKDLEEAIKMGMDKYGIEGVVTGAVGSVYQASRVQKICNKLGIECFNPLWQKDQFELLDDLVKSDFEIIITGVFAYPFDKGWLERKIDEGFIKEMKQMWEKYKINPAGEGGEFESFVLDCPLFKKKLRVKRKEVSGEGNSWRMEVEVS